MLSSDSSLLSVFIVTRGVIVFGSFKYIASKENYLTSISDHLIFFKKGEKRNLDVDIFMKFL